MIGKITKQELHPKLVGEIESHGNKIEELENRPSVVVSDSEPANSMLGQLWYNTNDMCLYIMVNNEWIEVCSGHGGSEPVSPMIDYNIKQEVVELTEEKEYIELPDGFTQGQKILKIFANGILLKEDLDFEFEDGKIYRKDGKNWNNNSSKTIFLFVSITDKEKIGYINFNHELIIKNRDVDEVELTSEASEIMKSNNAMLFLNKIKVNENEYVVSKDKINKKEGVWKADPTLFFEFVSFSVNKDVFGAPGETSVLEKPIEMPAEEDDPDTYGYSDGDGYSGTLIKKLKSEGKTITEEKFITEQDKEEYKDKDGYKGTLEKYLHEKGKTVVKEQKIVLGATKDDPDTMEYDKDGYKGTLKKYSKKPEGDITKEVELEADKDSPDTYEYNQDGFKGVLKKELISGELTPEKDTRVYKYKGKVTKKATSNTLKKEVELEADKDSSDTFFYDQDGFKGTLTKKLISGELKPSETREITEYDSPEYDKDGFKGILEKYVHSGEYIPADTKYVSEQTSSNYDKDGYIGKLERYLYSGSYTTSDSKSVTESVSIYLSVSAKYDNDGKPSVIVSSIPKTHKYNKNGYKGTLDSYGVGSESSQLDNAITDARLSKGTPGSTKSFGGGNYTQQYKGTVTKPASDTRVYRYRGDVTKPETDTRVYKYRGTVTKPEEDTRVYKYVGTITKEVNDTIYYYEGIVKKTITTEDIYKYKGFVYKEIIIDPVYVYNGIVTKKIESEGDKKRRPKISKYKAETFNQSNECVVSGLSFTSNAYYEVVVNGVYLYPNDYTMMGNIIRRTNGEKWDAKSSITIIEVSGININYS